MNKLIGKNIKKERLTSVSILSFMMLCAFLCALTCFLFSNLLGAVDHLMEKGRTPDMVQMHTGDIDEAALADFVNQHKEIVAYQTLLFLNIDNSQILLNDQPLTASSQDNGLVTQSQHFDYLLDLEDQVIVPQQGQIYLPIAYQGKYNLTIGQKISLVNQTFQIGGFLRDSQMTSMMASSKRWLISETDMQQMLDKGEPEYLIEFQLAEASQVDSLIAAYHHANLPANGPTITKSLIRLVNGLSDGLMIFVILFSSLALLMIAILCIRLVILMTLEQDKKNIGTLKAIGYTSKAIQAIYFKKYLPLALTGALMGGGLAFFVQRAISERTFILYGGSNQGLTHLLSGLVGCVVAEGIILWSIRKTMTKVRRMSALAILLEKNEQKGQLESLRMRKRFGRLVAVVIGVGLLLVTTPINLWHTLSSSSFVTYMGIGESDIRIDLQQSEPNQQATHQLLASIQTHAKVEDYVALTSYSLQVNLPNKEQTRLFVESGNHQLFPVSYIKGRAPQEDHDIAVSYLYASNHHLKVGDYLSLDLEKGSKNHKICGIYSDITNGGKTAKVSKLTTTHPPIWHVIYLKVKSGELAQVADELELESQKIGIDSKIMTIQDYVKDLYGSTLHFIQQSIQLATGVALAILAVVTYLFIGLILTLDRNDIALLKAIGWTSKAIKKNYALHHLRLSALSIVFGSLCAFVVGELSTSAILQNFGAAGFHFIISWKWLAGYIPLLFFLIVLLFMILALKAIDRIKIYQSFKERG